MREHYTTFRTYIKKKKSLSKGDLVVSSEPFAHIINQHHSSNYCDHCLVPRTKKLLKPCKFCRVPWYCGEDCVREGWDIHKYECRRLKNLAPFVPSSFVRLLARIIFKLKNGGDKIVEKYNEKDGRKFRDLMNHYADVKNDKESKKDIDYLLKALDKYIGKENLPNYSDFLGIYGRVLVNRFCIFDETILTFGSGVFLAASIFDHACIPNCYVSFSGRKVQIRSLVDMEELDYSKLRISYIDPVTSVVSRREDLHAKWYFWCDCKTCADQERAELENSLMCETKGCNTLIYLPETYNHKVPPIDCKNCKQPVDKERIRLYRQIVIFTRYHLGRLSEENPNFTECLEILERQSDLLHPMNVWRVRTLDFIFNAAVHNGCWALVLEYGDKNYEGMNLFRRQPDPVTNRTYYYGKTHPTYALFLFKLGKAKIYLKEFREGVSILEEAEPLLKAGLGPNHPVIIEQLIPTNLLANEDIEICLERRIAASKKRETERNIKKDMFLLKADPRKATKSLKPINKAA